LRIPVKSEVIRRKPRKYGALMTPEEDLKAGNSQETMKKPITLRTPEGLHRALGNSIVKPI
jgi:hypothetical protein